MIILVKKIFKRRYISYYLGKYSSCYLGEYFKLSLLLLLCINQLCISTIFVTDLPSINKNVTPMVKGQIYFGLSESLAKFKILLYFCLRLKVILHLF